MTVINPNSVAGINSITVQSGEALSVHKSDGTLIQTIVSSTGISTFSSVSVGSATTTNNADKSINIGLGASISQHSNNTLTFGTAGDPVAKFDASGQLLLGTGTARQKLHINASDSGAANMVFTNTTTGTSAGDGFIIGISGAEDAQINMQESANLKFSTADTERLRITSSGRVNAVGIVSATGGLQVGAAATIKSNGNATFAGIVTATSFVGDGSGLTGAGPTLADGSDNRVVTATGANAIKGEASLVYTGSRFGVNIAGGTITDIPATAHDTMVVGHSSMTSGGICLEGSSSSGNLGFQMFKGGSFLAARMLYQFSLNELQFHSATGASPGAGEATRLRLKPDGDVQIEDGNLVVASGHGIDFSATSDGSGTDTSELLDDYEEGTWTPVLNNAGGFGTNNTVGTYTKVGRLVTFIMQISGVRDSSSASGTFYISGLPFAADNSTGGHGQAGCMGALYNWNIPNTAYQIGIRVADSQSYIQLFANFDNAADAQLTTPFDANKTIFGSLAGSYYTS